MSGGGQINTINVKHDFLNWIRLNVYRNKGNGNAASSIKDLDLEELRQTLCLYSHPQRWKILLFLLEYGAASAPLLAQRLRISHRSAREVLARFTEVGVVHRVTRTYRGMGRPVHIYALYDASEEQVRRIVGEHEKMSLRPTMEIQVKDLDPLIDYVRKYYPRDVRLKDLADVKNRLGLDLNLAEVKPMLVKRLGELGVRVWT
jgi:predicted transcriptional regulator